MQSFTSFFKKGEIRTYRKKEMILSPDIKPEGIYFLEEGFVYGYSRAGNNKKKIQTIMTKGDIFPILQLTTNTPSRFYVEALTDIQVRFLPSSLFFPHVYSDKYLTQEFIQALASYLNRYVERVENLELETITKKVIARLLHFSNHFGKKIDNNILLKLPLTHDFIAESINVSRENVSRELNKLQKENLISFEGKYLIIHNEQVLLQRI